MSVQASTAANTTEIARLGIVVLRMFLSLFIPERAIIPSQGVPNDSSARLTRYTLSLRQAELFAPDFPFSTPKTLNQIFTTFSLYRNTRSLLPVHKGLLLLVVG